MGCNHDVLSRLKKVEGQVRGIQKMVEDERYCVDILTQLAAVRAAVNKVGLMVLEGHTKGCMIDALSSENQDQKVEELMNVLSKFLK